jgi:polyisoprenoid-binding protein YceI
MTKTGTISFHSHTFLENVDAVNDHSMAVIDANKKNLAFSCLMKQFIFPKKLMQEHFNENYVESDKYPKATFSGSYTEDVPFDKDGTYPIHVSGKLTIHGVTKDVQVPATLTVKGTAITGTATFKVNPTDYNISIPFIVREKIEKENTVNIKIEWTKKY